MQKTRLIKLREDFSLSRRVSDYETQLIKDVEKLKNSSELLSESDLVKFYEELDTSSFVGNLDPEKHQQQLITYFQDLYLLSIILLTESEQNDVQIAKYAYFQFVAMVKCIESIPPNIDIKLYIDDLINQRLYDNFSYSKSFKLGNGLARIKSPKSTLYELKHLLEN